VEAAKLRPGEQQREQRGVGLGTEWRQRVNERGELERKVRGGGEEQGGVVMVMSGREAGQRKAWEGKVVEQ
jgi:hypothetical protein